MDYKRSLLEGVVKKYKLTDILTFNKSVIPKEITIGFYLKKIEQYIAS